MRHEESNIIQKLHTPEIIPQSHLQLVDYQYLCKKIRMMINAPKNNWLPTTLKEVQERGWGQLDVILFSGDAYVDHPSFGSAVIGRIIESCGLKIAIVPQPNWRDDLRDFKKLGTPRLFFGVTSGCMDSMINHYTASKRLRSDDAYTPGGRAGQRPDYAVNVYCNILKQLYPDTPIVIGGIEASLRRVTHYDYWQNKLLPSILFSSQADLLIYGMGEKPLLELIEKLQNGIPFNEIKDIPQTAFVATTSTKSDKWDDIELVSHNECLTSKKKYAQNFKIIEEESNRIHARRIIQRYNDNWTLINPPYPPLSEKDIDAVYNLPFTRLPHPKYQKKEPIPAYDMIRHSINIHRGCFGGCSFCTISAHQGKFIVSRSEQSIMNEIEQTVHMHDFKGYISDLGGPSANMYKMQGKELTICEKCKRPSCIFPAICNNLDTNHNALTNLYQKAAKHPLIKKIFIGSGVRYDLFFKDGKTFTADARNYFKQLVTHHVSGRLKVAPEHTEDNVLKIMRKPSFSQYYILKKEFDKNNQDAGLNQQLIPYFISSHPGCSELDMVQVAIKSKELGLRLEQVQDFTPSPMTLSTEIFYTGLHPYTLEPILVTSDENSKRNQNKYLFWHKKENHDWIRNRLETIGKRELINKLLGFRK